MPGALYASARGLRRRAAPWWGAAGLALALPFAALLGWGEPSGLATGLAALAVVLWARWRWRASQAALARWRAQRDRVLEEELRALRRRGRDG